MPLMTGYDPGIFCWVDLLAHDLEATAGFYTALMGWRVTALPTESGNAYASLSLDGDSIAGIGQMPQEMRAEGLPQMWNHYVSVEDLDATVAKVTEHGGTITLAPKDVLDFGRLAFFQDPTGAQLGVWQPKGQIGATRVNDPGCFCWNELATRDATAAMAFFNRVFGWQYEDMDYGAGPYQVIRQAGRGNGGILTMNEEWGDLPPHWTVYFSVADLESTAAKIPGLGGKVAHGPFDTPVGAVVVATDPGGAHFSLIELHEGPE